jgi:hypothetical protein
VVVKRWGMEYGVMNEHRIVNIRLRTYEFGSPKPIA